MRALMACLRTTLDASIARPGALFTNFVATAAFREAIYSHDRNASARSAGHLSIFYGILARRLHDFHFDNINISSMPHAVAAASLPG